MKRDVPHFRIGLLLTEAGILAPQQLDQAIQQGDAVGQPFLKLLVSSGTLKQHELQAVIRAQSLIWSGLLDVERAIQALNIVHTNNVSIDEGLLSVGWVRPESSMSETIASSVLQIRPEVTMAPPPGTSGRHCQYCGTPLQQGTSLCTFCTGDNSRSIATKLPTEPVWDRHEEDVESVRITATSPARDPLFMGFLSGFCLPGLGQIVIGQSAKGACLLILTLVLAFISGGITSLLVFPVAGLDAYLLADKLRNGKSIGPWEFF